MNSTAPRNTTDTRRRALPLILLFPVAIALSACRSTFAFNSSDPNNATLVIEFDTEIRGSTAKCSSLQPILDRQRNYIGEGTVEEVPGSVGVGCRVTYSKFTAFGRVMFMRQRGDEITVEISKPFWDAIVTQLKQANVPEAGSPPSISTSPSSFPRTSSRLPPAGRSMGRRFRGAVSPPCSTVSGRFPRIPTAPPIRRLRLTGLPVAHLRGPLPAFPRIHPRKRTARPVASLCGDGSPSASALEQRSWWSSPS